MPDVKTPRQLQLVDQVLTNVARAYRPDGFIYDRVAPTIPVQAESGRYPIYTGMFGDSSDADTEETKVSDRAETPEITLEYSDDTYLCEDYRLKVSITAKERRQAHAALRLEQTKLQNLLDRMALRREIRIANLLRHSDNSGALTGGTATPGTKWDQDAATIETDIVTGMLAVRNKVGRVTNSILLDFEVAAKVAKQQDIREIIKYTLPGDMILARGMKILPPVLWGHDVIVADVMRNSARRGATESLAAVWADHVRLLLLPGDGVGGWGVPATAYSFQVFGEQVDRWRENDPPVDFIRAWEDLDEKVCGPDSGYEISDVL